MFRPFRSESISSSKRSISTTNDERIDPMLDQIQYRFPSPLHFSERSTTSRPNERSPSRQESSHVIPTNLRNSKQDQLSSSKFWIGFART